MSKTTEKIKKAEESVRRVALVTLLYLIPSAQALLPIDDPDIWWRLRTGQWVVEQRAAPLEDYFSTSALGKVWIEYSWLFDLIMYGTHELFELTGLVYFVVAMALLITFVVHRLLRRAGTPIPVEVALLAVAMSSLKPLMTPRPWLFTMLLFALELHVIDRVRRSGQTQLLWVLPLVFTIWANLHIQFVYGLAVLGLLIVEAVLLILFQRRGLTIQAPAFSVPQLVLVFLACCFATLLTPYHYLLYQQILEYVGQTGAFENISELHPMFFRSADSWLVLLLTLTSAFILGWRRAWLPFPILMFLMAAFLAFRARRDAWVMALITVWIVGDFYRAVWQGQTVVLKKKQVAAAAASIAAALYLFSVGRQISESQLQAAVAEKFPVEAARFVKTQAFSGPVFNDYDWGGFLLWSLPNLLVTIDGRLNLFGDPGLERSLNTWQGGPGWNSDPGLLAAKVVIAKKPVMLAALLRADARFKVAYEDNLAVVFVALE